QAVERSLAAGLSFSVATAANGTDACYFSPGRVPGAITVAPTDVNDHRASFSDYGTCLDLFAPGVNITTIDYTGGTRIFTGTTMSVSHVAGVVALYLQTYPAATPQQVHDAINRDATSGVVVNPGPGSPNRLVHSLLT
ncbi:MAG TPA: S8 family serine peptidase, partial [Micromonosporaceae bacterium]|nr:S8 family serine peptidase [Micromonosporaceae bacterium]